MKPRLVEGLLDYSAEFEKALTKSLQKEKAKLKAEGIDDIPDDAFKPQRKANNYTQFPEEEMKKNMKETTQEDADEFYICL